jgi:hypothetical protein
VFNSKILTRSFCCCFLRGCFFSSKFFAGGGYFVEFFFGCGDFFWLQQYTHKSRLRAVVVSHTVLKLLFYTRCVGYIWENFVGWLFVWGRLRLWSSIKSKEREREREEKVVCLRYFWRKKGKCWLVCVFVAFLSLGSISWDRVFKCFDRCFIWAGKPRSKKKSKVVWDLVDIFLIDRSSFRLLEKRVNLLQTIGVRGV